MSSSASTGDAGDRNRSGTLQGYLNEMKAEEEKIAQSEELIQQTKEAIRKSQESLRKSEEDVTRARKKIKTCETRMVQFLSEPASINPSVEPSDNDSTLLPTDTSTIEEDDDSEPIPASRKTRKNIAYVSKKPKKTPGRNTRITTNGSEFTVHRYLDHEDSLSQPRTYQSVEVGLDQPTPGVVTLKLDPARFKQKLREMGQLRGQP